MVFAVGPLFSTPIPISCRATNNTSATNSNSNSNGTLALDASYVKRAADLADKSAGFTSPHPNFGCLIATNAGRVVGEGYLYAQGTKPAEVQAVEAAAGYCRGATAYVNMEPGDCHGDRTAVSALIKAGISRVVVGIRHPLQHLRGNAIRGWRSEGVQVDVLGEDLQSSSVEEALKSCLLVNAPLLYRAASQVPFSILKYAMTLDGKIAASSGHASWISSRKSRTRVLDLRGRSDAVIVGGNTVRRDNPRLTARNGGGHVPLRIIMSQTLDLPEVANVWDVSEVPTIVATQRGARKSFQKFLASKGVEVVEFDILNPKDVVEYLYDRGYLSLMWECGGTLAASAISSGIIHKVYAFVAPKIIGGKSAPSPIGELGMVEMTQALELIDVCYEQIGPDMLISGFLQPVPDLTPAIPSVIETSAVDPTVSPYESNIIFFYKTWDLYGAFSNFSPHPIQVPDGNGDYSTWPSVEHYYQAQKFVGVTDPVARDYMEDIKSAKSPEEAARLARKIQRQHPHLDNLSAVDILSACNLVNYFGKIVLGGSGVGEIVLYPILIRKGSSSIALYGLGNIRDERLNRMFQTPHAVQWMRPEAQEGCQVSDWFNILVLHQNRVKANPKNAINEHFLPRFLDFIVWGHEHECLVDPQEVPGMGFHITQPGSSVATSLIDGESKPKHVLLIEIKGNQYRPTKIPLSSVRPFEYKEVVLKDEPDIDPNDQNSILERLDSVVSSLIDKASRKDVSKSELKLPLVRLKVDYSGFMTINPQRFGQKYVGKVANPQDILIFSKSVRRGPGEAKINDSERLRPEELNQQNIEALVAESNLKMEILPVNDLDVALHNFINKDDRMAFLSCVQYNLEETRKKIALDPETMKYEEEDLVLKVGESLEARVKERSQSKAASQFPSSAQSLEDLRSKGTGLGSAVSFSDNDEDTTQLSGSKSTARGRKGSSQAFRSARDASEVAKTSTRGRGRGRGRGSSKLKQTTLDAAMVVRHSGRSASAAATASVRSIAAEEENLDSASSDEAVEYGVDEVQESSEDDENLPGKGRKRTAPRGRGRASGSTAKRGRKSDNTSSSSIQKILMSKDDEDDDDDDLPKKMQKSQPRVTRNYGALRR